MNRVREWCKNQIVINKKKRRNEESISMGSQLVMQKSKVLKVIENGGRISEFLTEKLTLKAAPSMSVLKALKNDSGFSPPGPKNDYIHNNIHISQILSPNPNKQKFLQKEGFFNLKGKTSDYLKFARIRNRINKLNKDQFIIIASVNQVSSHPSRYNHYMSTFNIETVSPICVNKTHCSFSCLKQ